MPKNPKGPGDFVTQAYNLKNPRQIKSFYREWASDYDRQLARLNYVSPLRIAELLHAHSPGARARILDIGCGTGLCGAALAPFGYAELVGIDISPEMLEVARTRGIYRELHIADLNRPLAFASDAFDAAICAGTFTHAHIGARPLKEIARVLKPGGRLACSVHFDLWDEFAAAFAELADAGELLEVQRQAGAYYLDGEHEGWFCLHQKPS